MWDIRGTESVSIMFRQSTDCVEQSAGTIWKLKTLETKTAAEGRADEAYMKASCCFSCQESELNFLTCWNLCSLQKNVSTMMTNDKMQNKTKSKNTNSLNDNYYDPLVLNTVQCIAAGMGLGCS